MFSGIVETTGIITSAILQDGCKHFTIQSNNPFTDTKIGDSIAINGVCLTVTALKDNSFNATAVPETLRLTNLKHLQTGVTVNLERSISANSRIGGHYVQGHVDATGTILDITKDNSEALLVKISVPENLARYVVSKGYIGLDGMSITVIDAADKWFTVTFIPHTQAVTIVQHYRVGQEINIEVDIMGKYIERLIAAKQVGAA